MGSQQYASRDEEYRYSWQTLRISLVSTVLYRPKNNDTIRYIMRHIRSKKQISFFSNFNIQNELILTFEIVIFHFLDTVCSPSYGVYISQLIVCCCSHGITVCVSCADQEGVHGSGSPPLPPPGKSQRYRNC